MKATNLKPKVGTQAMEFSLPDTASQLHGPPAGSPCVIVFTCNHCPYALAWHNRIIDAAADYMPRGVQFLAINSNDAARYPADAPERMRERVEAGELGEVPYLIDAEQTVARSYDAQVTPDLFVLDAAGVIRYRGAPDADYEQEQLRAQWLREALESVLAGERPRLAESDPVGCSIKWRAD